tara:strand:- start:806 stop:1318 length:513 start_codon:yes stop_codon:yes gene_type:complete
MFLNSCGKSVDATKYPPDPKERVKKNLEEGKGFRLSTKLKGLRKGSGDFDFASSNSLWRASLDIIDFMPLATANYSGGIIVTDWYSDDVNSNESLKVTIRFLTNEIRSDAIDLKIFYKICKSENNCSVSEKKGQLSNELKKEILKQAAIYEKTRKDKDFKPYKVLEPKEK